MKRKILTLLMIFVEASQDETWTNGPCVRLSESFRLIFDVTDMMLRKLDSIEKWLFCHMLYVVYSRAFYGLVRPRPGHLGDEVSQIKNVDERFTFMFYKRNINENFRGVNFGSLGL